MLIWEKGRQLKRVKEGNSYYRYTYNADGIRIKKEAKGITYTYFVDDNGNLLGEKREGEGVNIRLTYEYDSTGICAFGYTDTVTEQSGKVYYQKNVQGDIIGINWASGVTACIYDYDAWGNVILQSGDQYILSLNRILYRGYYQDIETGWYYLQSRYYDPSVCRFINADGIDYLDTESLTGLNLYTYCANNPVMYVDPSGHELEWYHWLAIAIGAVLVVAGAATLIAAGAGAAISLVAIGAAKGALIGAAVGTAAGAGIGYISGGEEGMWEGMALGFGIGAVAGAAIGAGVGKLQEMGKISFKVRPDKIVNNPKDPFSQRFIGPKQGRVDEKIWKLSGTDYYEPLPVTKLSNGLYELQNGHHTFRAMKSMGLKYIRIKISP